MNDFSDVGPGVFMPDPRCVGANAFPYPGRTPPPALQLEAACKEDFRRQDVPKVSHLRGMRLLSCFGSKPSGDTIVVRARPNFI